MKSFVIRNLLSREEVFDLIALKDDRWMRASSISEKRMPTITGARITEASPINYLQTHTIGAKVIRKANELFNNKYYCNEAISILKYDAKIKAKFDWHKDTIDYTVFADHKGDRVTDPEKFYLMNRRPTRDVSITIALNNRSDYNGGIFKLQCDESDLESEAKIIDLNIGDAVLFDSKMKHGVTPVTGGIRYSAIFWLYELEKYYECWDDTETEPAEGWDRFKRYYEEHNLPL